MAQEINFYSTAAITMGKIYSSLIIETHGGSM